jgi:hypothetical protein
MITTAGSLKLSICLTKLATAHFATFRIVQRAGHSGILLFEVRYHRYRLISYCSHFLFLKLLWQRVLGYKLIGLS